LQAEPISVRLMKKREGKKKRGKGRKKKRGSDWRRRGG
jgi:hypothetical protein